MNSYQKYLSNLPKHIYKGEPIDILKKKLNISISEDNIPFNMPIKPPKGTILVGKEYNNWWIFKLESFYGWNIERLSIMSTQIE